MMKQIDALRCLYMLILTATHHLITASSNSLPLRPPAPLFQSQGDDFITLSLRIDPNDSTRRINAWEGSQYVLQMENKVKGAGRFEGSWMRILGEIEGESNRPDHFAVATVTDLSADYEYRFRTQVSNQSGSSPWSLPSRVMSVEVLTPHAPVNLTVVTKSPHSVKISWDLEHNDPSSIHDRTHYHIVQYRLHADENGSDSTNSFDWMDHPIPLSVVSRLPTPEIQEITTLVDEGSSISSGFFWLRLDVPTDDPAVHYNKLESSKVSGPIPFNASEEDIENAIRQIDGIRSVRAFRYEVGKYGSSILANRGRFSWRIEFDVVGGPISLFEVFKDTLDGEFSGGYDRVSVRSILKGRPIEFVSSLVADIGKLEIERYYDFRVGHKNVRGERLWSEILRIKTASPLLEFGAARPSDRQINSKHAKLMKGDGRFAANNKDLDYITGAGMGGTDSQDGKDGLVVIISYGTDEMIIPSRTYFYYTGNVQHFVVSDPVGRADWSSKERSMIDIKCWGGGGSGGHYPKNTFETDGLRNGGGGGFAQTRLLVEPGTIFSVQVGYGGKFSPLDGEHFSHIGFNKGIRDSTNFIEPNIGGNGGFTAVLQSDGNTVALAEGGTGGDSTDNCCVDDTNCDVACSGEGGFGYIDYTWVYVNEEIAGYQHKNILPPTITQIAHDAIQISWETHQQNSRKQDIRFYHIELSQGRESAGSEGGSCSDDYRVADNVRAGTEFRHELKIDKLEPNTAYCIRLVAVGQHRGMSRKSDSIRVVTLPRPKNIWWLTYPRENYELLQRGVKSNGTLFCEVPHYPTSRRGHTITFVNGKVYLFGGLTKTCICRDDEVGSCGEETIYTNEVWSLNPRTNIWTLLKAHNWKEPIHVPRGREQHSATILSNGKIIIIGGRSDHSKTYTASEHPLILGDMWEMDPGRSSSHNIFAGEGDIASKVLPLNMRDGGITFHSLEINLGEEYNSNCIASLSVSATIYHPCVEQLGFISLYGPGSTPSRKQPSNFTGNDAKLYIGESFHSGQCSAANLTISFSDNAHVSLTDHNLIYSGLDEFLPAENIGSHFKGFVADGEWTLALHDRVRDGKSGGLINWGLDVNVEPCEDGIQWSRLSSDSNSCETGTAFSSGSPLHHCSQRNGDHSNLPNKIFTPRYSHSAIAIGKDIYVYGGFANGYVPEMWRYHYSSKTWTELHGVHSRKMNFGQPATLTPYGVISFDGLAQGKNDDNLEPTTYFYDVTTEKKLKLKTDPLYPGSDLVPSGRYLSGMTFIGQNHILFNYSSTEEFNSIGSVIEPGIIMFAGDVGLPENNFLGDQWVLTLEHLFHSTENLQNNHRRAKECHELLEPSKTGNNPFDWTCGDLADVNSTSPCRWEDLLKAAWCVKQFNSFISPF